MKKFVFILLSLLSFTVFAQREQENWFMGTYLGMKFTAKNMNVIPVNTSKMYAPYSSATWSDPGTGALLFYTNGLYVINKQHQQMPNGFQINIEAAATHTVIVPNPTDKNLFYIFTTPATSTTMLYAEVDMRLQGGLGDVTGKGMVLDNNADLPFCVVKQLYGEGYWLITHTSATDEFKSYRIGSNGLETTPVISHAGAATTTDPRYTYGKMVSNSTGDRFVFSHGMLNRTDKQAVCEEFLFDKECGTIQFNRSFGPHVVQAVEQFSYPAYSADDSKLYVSWIYDSGQSFLVQYDLTQNNPNSTYKIINGGINMNGDMQLAPDGKIYVATSENAAVTGKVSVIEMPDLLAPACNFRDRVILLSSNPSLHYTEHFPEFVMDRSKPLPGKEKPEMLIENGCEGQPVTFALKNALLADSFQWNLGDGNIVKTLNVTHQYAAVSNYVVSFEWYDCGYKYAVTDTLKLRIAPKVNLGNDTTFCAGYSVKLTAPVMMDEYVWNTGNNTAAITVTKPGKYAVKVRSGNCWGADTVMIKYYDQLWTTLGDEYFICDDDKELVKLDAGEGFEQYKWTPTGDTSQWIVVGDLGAYFVVVKDYRGCSGKDGTKVERRCPVSVFYPNAFTPNNDGVNDVFLPVGSDVMSFKIELYNAWGQKIFESYDLTKGWDGKVNGVPSPSGTYIYKSSYSGYRNKNLVEFVTEGNITLLR